MWHKKYWDKIQRDKKLMAGNKKVEYAPETEIFDFCTLMSYIAHCYSFIVLIFTFQLLFLNSSTQYDYIIAGAGCAGLSLAVHMIHSGKFSDKKILIVDKDDKQKNDRTWCFWEKEPGLV